MADSRTRTELLAEIERLENINEELNGGYSNLEAEKDELEAKLDELGDLIATCEKLLDEISRDCGSRKFTIPDTDRVHDAIREMANSTGRNI